MSESLDCNGWIACYMSKCPIIMCLAQKKKIMCRLWYDCWRCLYHVVWKTSWRELRAYPLRFLMAIVQGFVKNEIYFLQQVFTGKSLKLPVGNLLIDLCSVLDHCSLLSIVFGWRRSDIYVRKWQKWIDYFVLVNGWSLVSHTLWK